MARGRNQSLNGAQVMVGMEELQDVLNAIDKAAVDSDWSSLNIMLRHYRDPGNPVRKLVNQYNAYVEFLATPTEGEA